MRTHEFTSKNIIKVLVETDRMTSLVGECIIAEDAVKLTERLIENNQDSNLFKAVRVTNADYNQYIEFKSMEDFKEQKSEIFSSLDNGFSYNTPIIIGDSLFFQLKRISFQRKEEISVFRKVRDMDYFEKTRKHKYIDIFNKTRNDLKIEIFQEGYQLIDSNEKVITYKKYYTDILFLAFIYVILSSYEGGKYIDNFKHYDNVNYLGDNWKISTSQNQYVSWRLHEDFISDLLHQIALKEGFFKNV